MSSKSPLKVNSGSDPRDRRASQRYGVVRTPVFLGWLEGSKHKIIYGSLTNVSLSGAALETEDAPPESGALWLRLNHAEFSEWIAATIVGVRKTCGIPMIRKPSYQIRLAFREACPYEVFKMAIEGFASYLEIPDMMYKDFDGRYWR
jgi:hypothetical protein